MIGGEPFDVVVVGAGSAGCVVAARLSERADRQVLLLEAGPAGLGEHLPPALHGADLFAAIESPGRTWGSLRVERTPGAGRVPYARGRGLGGSSAVNGMVAIPGEPGDYDRWEVAGATGWNDAAVMPYALRTSLPLRPATIDEIGPVGRALRSAWGTDDLGVPLTRDSEGRRVSCADAYLVPAVRRPNLTIRTGALVDRVVIEGRTAVGVLLADGTEIGARRVVVCAGAIHSPAILLRSGLERRGVGHGLVDHPAFAVTLVPHAPASPGSLVISTAAPFSSSKGRNDLQLLAVDHLGADAPGLAALMVALMDGRSAGTVRLADSDPLADPIVDFDLLADPGDLAALREGVARLAEVLEHPAFVEAFTVHAFEATDDGLRAGLGEYSHAAGTCRMGAADDPDAVVDPDGRVIDHVGLAVCDASIFPRLPRANPHLPTVMVAERLCDRWELLGN